MSEEVKEVVQYPKWVKPHDSHIVRKKIIDGQTQAGFTANHLVVGGEGPEHVSTPAFPQCHVNRETGEVTVLVKDEDEEKVALAAHDTGEKHEEEHLDERIEAVEE